MENDIPLARSRFIDKVVKTSRIVIHNLWDVFDFTAPRR